MALISMVQRHMLRWQRGVRCRAGSEVCDCSQVPDLCLSFAAEIFTMIAIAEAYVKCYSFNCSIDVWSSNFAVCDESFLFQNLLPFIQLHNDHNLKKKQTKKHLSSSLPPFLPLM